MDTRISLLTQAASTPSVNPDSTRQRRRRSCRRQVVGVVLALSAAALLMIGVARLLATKACDGTASAPCSAGTLLDVAALLLGIGLAIAATFAGTGFLAFAATCFALGAGSFVGGAHADMSSFPFVFGAGWTTLGLPSVGLWCWLRPHVRERRR